MGKGGKAAFPLVVTGTDNHGKAFLGVEYGLSKREMFAAMAMQGLVAYGFSTDPNAASDLAVKHADALIAKLEKSNDQKLTAS